MAFDFTDASETLPATRIPKLRWPFEMTARGAATCEQDSIQEVAQCAYTILATEYGSCSDLPDFGIEDPTFLLNGADIDELEAVVAKWEPRAKMLTESDWDRLVQEVKVRVGV